jgi:hypothetical protein
VSSWAGAGSIPRSVRRLPKDTVVGELDGFELVAEPDEREQGAVSRADQAARTALGFQAALHQCPIPVRRAQQCDKPIGWHQNHAVTQGMHVGTPSRLSSQNELNLRSVLDS